ncbi:MAG TPA: glycoside hydrolase family 2 TIM barrel-domain containing protein [Phototrophicaceae bacterium]|nr:glycoside hydrolase family 2 TIM barrel-domain containing protein [Phototrophicaceae bacterium]
MRLQRSLAGQWAFQLDPEGALSVDQLQPGQQITVPLPIQAAFPELEHYSGYTWAQTTFPLDDVWLQGELLLRFGAVDYFCQVYVNGQLAGEHEGGYTPFTLAIRPFVQAGANTLTVRVYDSVMRGGSSPRWRGDPVPASGHPRAEDIPHGKQTWYLDVSGIWQDVTLTAVPTAYIERVHITPNLHSNEAHVEVRLGGALTEGTLRVGIASSASIVRIKPDETTYHLTLHVADAQRWTPETPTLYTAYVCVNDEQHVDEIRVRFGFREIKAEHGRLLLNGEPLMLLSALDQDFYPETIYTVPSEAYLRDEFSKAKALGLNSLRCHIKPPDPLYLDLADEMGLLIWAEIPSWRTFYAKTTHFAPVLDDALQARARQTLAEMIERDFNHPSLIIWTIINEDWGTMLPLRAEDRAWVAGMVDLCHQLDPTRLVVDNSACGAAWGTNLHVKSDLNDYHIYTNIPDAASDFVRFVEQFALRPAWLFSLTGDGSPTGEEPLLLSEFGNWGLPALSEMTRNGEPKWFDLIAWWSPWEGEPGIAHGAQERFKAYGLDQIWPDYDSFAEATQWHQFAALKFEIETLRRQQEIQGYVITELTDIYWESNGLLDFYRRPKVFHEQFSQFNTLDVIAPKLERWAYWEGEKLEAAAHVSHYSGVDWSGARFQIRLGDAVTGTLPPLKRGDVHKIDDFDWTVPESRQTQLQSLDVEISDNSGKLLAQSHTPILVLPSSYRQAVYRQPISYAGDTLDILTQLGYQVASGTLCVADQVDAALLDWVAQGGDLLHLCDGANPFLFRFNRNGAYSGNWMTSFNWLRPGVYQRLQGVSNPLSLPFEGITPQGVFVNLPVDNPAYHGDFLAGQVTGWVGHPALHTVQFRYGKGRVITTTYRLKNTQHPAAVAMLHDLIDYLASDKCDPNLTLKA